MFLSTLYLSISRSIDGGRAFSTLEIWSCVFQSREFRPCALLPCFPVPSFPPLRFGPTFPVLHSAICRNLPHHAADVTTQDNVQRRNATLCERTLSGNCRKNAVEHDVEQMDVDGSSRSLAWSPTLAVRPVHV